jgi:hypothetical protein
MELGDKKLSEDEGDKEARDKKNKITLDKIK